MPPQEQKEKAPETGKRPEFTAEAPFDAKKEWNQQVTQLISDAMGKRYQQHMSPAILTYITTGKDYKNFQEHMEEIVKMRLDAGTVTFFDKEGKPLASFDIAAGMKELIEMAKEHDCDICRRRSRRLRQYEFRNTSYADMLRQIYAQSDVPLGRRLAKPAPLSADEIAANQRLTELFEGRKASREMILATAESMDDEEYDILAHVSPKIKDDDAEEFERHWRFMDGSNDIDGLFNEVPNLQEGYQVNPFNLSPDKKWNREKLRQLIQGSGLWNRNDRLYFKEVNEMIYEDRFEDFKKDLESAGVPKVATGLLEGENLQKDYKKLTKLSAELDDIKDPTKIPEKYKNIWPHREKLKAVIQVLGDYIAYATRLVNYVNQLRWNPAKPAEDRERLMTEFERDSDGMVIDNPANRVKESLHELFVYGVSSPREYSGELSQIFRGKDSHRKITFQDLNGQTATLEGDRFSQYQSPETAYKLAFEEIEERRQNPDGTWTNEIGEKEETAAIEHLNDLLQLGIATHNATPEHRSFKQIIDALESKGVEVSPGVKIRFTGNPDVDLENLRQALSIKTLIDLKKSGTDAEKLIAKERTNFIRIGSVIYQHNTFNKKERAQEQREREKQSLAVVKLSPEEAETIIEQLRKTKQFDEPRLAQIKQTLVGGVGILLGEKPGAGLFLKYDLGNGWSIDFAAGGFKGGAFAGVGASKKFEIKEDIDITVHAGPGYLFGSENGPMVGVGASVTKKFPKIDVSFQTGVGIFFGAGGVIPSIPIGGGLDWGKEKEKFQETVSKKELEAKTDELDKSGDPYEEVKRNPSKYPQLAQLLYSINSMSEPDAASKKSIFEETYKIFKEGLRSEAVKESEPGWWRYIVPSGMNFGVVLVGGVIPVPYIAVTYNLWSRKLVYRVASPVSRAQEISEAEATEAILKHVQGAKTIEAKPLRTTKEVAIDPKTGNVMLRGESSGTIDFKELGHLNRFQQLRDALSADAKIFVDPADIEGQNMGLILLSPQEAHGDVEVYIDPEFKDDVVLVTRGGKLYLSVKKDRTVYLKREDITYPFLERGATEKTTITISANPHLKTDVIKSASGWYFDRTATSEWVRRPAVSDATPEGREKQKQSNLMAGFEDYARFWGDGRSDRLEFTSLEGLHESYDKLNAAITLKGETEIDHLRMRPAVKDKIDALVEQSKKDPKKDPFIQEFRRLSTEGFNVGKITANWHTDFPSLTKFITEQIGQGELTHDELNAAMLSFLMASFLNIQQEGDEKAKAKFIDALKGFETKILTSVFTDYYKDKIPDSVQRQKKIDEAVKWVFAQLEHIDITAKGDPGEAGLLFATTVGMGGVTGLRRMVNYFEGKDPKWGVVGKQLLDPRGKGTAGEVADFWLQTLSPYTPGLQNQPIPNPEGERAEYLKYQDQMYDQLHSPLVLKLVPLVAITFTPAEMYELTKIYEGAWRTASTLITKDNIDVVKKLLDWTDKIRQAELNGEKETKLDENFKIVFDVKLWMGAYKECGNITGMMREHFGLVHEGNKTIYFAGMGEGIIDVSAQYDRVDFKVMVGAAVPIPRGQRVAQAPRQPPPPRKPPPSTPPEGGRPVPTPTIPTAEPLPPPTATPAGGEGQEGSTTGGGATEGSGGTSTGNESSAGV